jgi:hypothetical protein
MKKQIRLIAASIIVLAFIVTSCETPLKMTTWTNPKGGLQVSKIAVWGMFDKLEYQKTFEQCVTSYINSHGLKAIEMLSVLTPGQKYSEAQLEKLYDSTGVDGILMVTYEGTDKNEKYIPQTAYVSSYDYYAWGYPMYGYGSSVVTTGGYWSVSSVVNLRANLYHKNKKDLLWSGEISVTDPKYIDQVSYKIASNVIADWQKNNLIKGK